MSAGRGADLLTERVIHACLSTRGTMPIALIVKDEAEKQRALALLKGRHHHKLIEVLTEAEEPGRALRASLGQRA